MDKITQTVILARKLVALHTSELQLMQEISILVSGRVKLLPVAFA